MSKVLFVNGNVHGHINPTLPVVRELIRRNEQVCYFSTAEFKQKIESTGAEFIDYGSDLTQFLKSFRPSGDHPFYSLIEFMLGMDRIIIPLVIEVVKAKGFDYIIHDSMFGGGRILAQKLGIPAICSCTSFAMSKLPMPAHMFEPGYHPQLDNVYCELKQAASEWETEMPKIMDIFFKKESLNLVFTSRMFQPESDDFDDSFKFIGPSIADRKEELDFAVDQKGKSTVLYISMGTINNNLHAFYGKCIQAFAGENLKVIMSVGEKIDMASLGDVPGNFIIRNYVPQLEVLKRADAFISHGGLNSVSEALYYGVPVIAIPQSNDQPMVTSQLVKLGAGIGLKMSEITPEILRNSVFTLLSDDGFRRCSNKIRDSFIKAGGYNSAVDRIFDFKTIQ